jgi:hypothetical protein
MWRDIALSNQKNILKALDELATASHSFKSLVVDSLDWMEPILHAQICRDHNAKSIELAAGGYGKGYIEATTRWASEFISRLNTLRAKGMNIVLVAHSDIVTFPDPQTQMEYKRYELKLHKKASALFREYVDAVLFANYEIFVKKDGDSIKTFGDGERIMHTERRPGYDAKNRYGLPLTIPLSWSEFEKAADNGQPDSAEAIVARIEGLATAIKDPELLAKVKETVATAGNNVATLTAIANRLTALTGEA